jgi:CubicO group peptidase (beta-lactamase class C family)
MGMGDGRAADGTEVLTPASLQAMRTNPGPGGTLVAEIDGFGISFGLRRTAEGVRVVIHGGSWAGQDSGFFFVPERDFAMTMLTNSDGGTRLRLDLFYDDWVLQRFVGLHNPPAEPMRLSSTRLAEYERTYVNLGINRAGTRVETVLTVQGKDGALSGEVALGDAVSDIGLTFYRDEYVLVERDGSGPGAVTAPTSCATPPAPWLG